MNAIQFIKDHGVEKARGVVEGAPETATHFTEALGGHYSKEGVLKMKSQWLWFNSINKEWYYDFAAKEHIHLPDLKRLVESVERIDGCGGLHGFKTYCNGDFSQEDLQAIADYEAIYSNN